MNGLSSFVLFFLLTTSTAVGQTINPSIPEDTHTSEKYLFYLHGGVVQQQGEDAVSPYYGEYLYLDILDTLQSRGFYVISEVRPKESGEIEYAEKVVSQVDSLVRAGVPYEQIIIVGASLGAYITLEAAYLLQESRINYAMLGLCSDYAVEYFSAYNGNLHGNFLSIFESNDEKGSCMEIFSELPLNSLFNEIEIDMGIGHAFLFKPYREWVKPLVEWIEKSGPNRK